MNNVEIGDIQEFKVKPHKVKAIQFTGKNGRQVAEFVKAHDENVYIRNGGKYMSFTDELGHKYTVSKSDFLVYTEFAQVAYMDESSFYWRHSVSKTHKLLS